MKFQKVIKNSSNKFDSYRDTFPVHQYDLSRQLHFYRTTVNSDLLISAQFQKKLSVSLYTSSASVLQNMC